MALKMGKYIKYKVPSKASPCDIIQRTKPLEWYRKDSDVCIARHLIELNKIELILTQNI